MLKLLYILHKEHFSTSNCAQKSDIDSLCYESVFGHVTKNRDASDQLYRLNRSGH